MKAVLEWLGRRTWLGRGVVQAVTVQFWLLLVEEALLSIGGMKFKATSLKSAQSPGNSHPASKESFWLRVVYRAEQEAVKPPEV